MNQSIIQIPPSVSRQYLVPGEKGYLLIDTGLYNNYSHLERYLTSKHISLSSVEMIVVTHADGDHYGCLNQILSKSPSTISAASAKEAEAIRLGESSRPLTPKRFQKVLIAMIGPLFKSKPARVDRILIIGEELPFLGMLEVLDTKGHTPEHISLWSPSTRTLFCGDSINIKGNTLLPSSGMNTWNVKLAIESFENQIALKPDRIYAGHGTWQRE